MAKAIVIKAAQELVGRTVTRLDGEKEEISKIVRGQYKMEGGEILNPALIVRNGRGFKEVEQERYDAQGANITDEGGYARYPVVASPRNPKADTKPSGKAPANPKANPKANAESKKTGTRTQKEQDKEDAKGEAPRIKVETLDKTTCEKIRRAVSAAIQSMVSGVDEMVVAAEFNEAQNRAHITIQLTLPVEFDRKTAIKLLLENGLITEKVASKLTDDQLQEMMDEEGLSMEDAGLEEEEEAPKAKAPHKKVAADDDDDMEGLDLDDDEEEEEGEEGYRYSYYTIDAAEHLKHVDRKVTAEYLENFAAALGVTEEDLAPGLELQSSAGNYFYCGLAMKNDDPVAILFNIESEKFVRADVDKIESTYSPVVVESETETEEEDEDDDFEDAFE